MDDQSLIPMQRGGDGGGTYAANAVQIIPLRLRTDMEYEYTLINRPSTRVDTRGALHGHSTHANGLAIAGSQ